MRIHPRTAALASVLALSLGVAACAPTNTDTTYSAADIGRPAQIAYGVIVSMRPVTVQGQPNGVGTVAGAAVGATAGSFIGGSSVRGNILGAIGGAVIGGLAGHAIAGGVSTGQAVEFIIRQDNGQTISVVQTDEENFRPGDRVVLTFGARTRISHAAG